MKSNNKFRPVNFLKLICILFIISSCGNQAKNNSSTAESSNGEVDSMTPPTAELSNGVITAKLYLPDNDKGYYRATRFDWSGIIYSLEYGNHSYIGQWFETYDPLVHESITGPAEEFGVIGFDSAQVGEGFLKIGVGVLKKDEKPYHFSNQYEIINHGERKITSNDSSIVFVHTLNSDLGYSYIYTKTVELTKGKPEIKIKHRLQNTGIKVIDTNVYDHNFFILDSALAGPDISLEFKFKPEAEEGRGLGELFEIQGNKLVYLKDLPVVDGKRTTGSTGITGFGASAEDYDIKIENAKTKAGLHIMGDKPIIRLRYWTSTTTYCPEPYIKIYVEPNKEMTWEYTYDLYTFD